MTDRLYYHNSFLYDFDADVLDVVDNPRPALILDRTAFYPTSGGQVFDTGTITATQTPNSALPKSPTWKTARSSITSKRATRHRHS